MKGLSTILGLLVDPARFRAQRTVGEEVAEAVPPAAAIRPTHAPNGAFEPPPAEPLPLMPGLHMRGPAEFAFGTALGTHAVELGVSRRLLGAIHCDARRGRSDYYVAVGELLQWTTPELIELRDVGWKSVATGWAAVDAVRLTCPGEKKRIYTSPLVASVIESWGVMQGKIGGHAVWRRLLGRALHDVARVKPAGFAAVPADWPSWPFGPSEPAPAPACEARVQPIEPHLPCLPGTGLGVPLSDMLAYRGIGRPVANAMASECGIPEKEVTLGHALGFGYVDILRMKDVGRGALARILAAGDAARLACPDQAETVLISPLARSTAGRWPDVKRELGGKVVWPDEVARALERLHELLPPGALRRPRSLPLYPFGRCSLPPGPRPPHSARPRLEITSRPVDRPSVFSLPFLDLVEAPLRLREAMSAMGLADRDATLLDVLDLDKGDLLDCRRVGRKTIADLAAILDAIRCTCPSTDTEILRAQLVRTMLVDDPTWPVCDRGRPSYLEADGGRRWPYLVAAMSAGVVAALSAEMGPLPFSLPSRPFGALDGTGWLADDRGSVVRRPRD